MPITDYGPKEGPDNWVGAVRDFRTIMAESRPIAAAPGDPSSRALIAGGVPL